MDYTRLWLTSSLRGIVLCDLTIECGKINYHSGIAGGIVPETFRILRALLDRVDDVKTGLVCPEFQVEPPEWKVKEAKDIAANYGAKLYSDFDFNEGVQPMHKEDFEALYMENTWRPNVSITGAEGLPPMSAAGNVVRSKTKVRISMRQSPGADARKMKEVLLQKLTTDVPYNAKITIEGDHTGNGWLMKELDPSMKKIVDEAAAAFYDGKPVGSYGIGGAIPFLNELETKFPSTSILAMGVLGPGTNAHAPNEMLPLDYTRRLTCALAHMAGDVSKL